MWSNIDRNSSNTLEASLSDRTDSVLKVKGEERLKQIKGKKRDSMHPDSEGTIFCIRPEQ